MRTSVLFCCVLLSACVVDEEGDGKVIPSLDSGFSDDTDTDSGTGTDSADDSGGDTEVPAEECNGVDDNGDGAVDEGFPDDDANGRADCMDSECPPLDLGTADTVAPVAACAADALVPDAFDAVLEWSYTVPGGAGPLGEPAVGELDDDNGDGVVDTLDTPDIAFLNAYPSVLYVISGDGSGLLWTAAGMGDYRGVAVADIDNDGVNEVLAFDEDDRVVAFDNAGVEKWRTAESFDFLWGEQFAIADLDADGDLEVVADHVILEGADGSLVAELPSSNNYTNPITADLDQDGTLEVILAGDVYDATGALLWSATVTYAMDDVFSAVVDADGDLGGEVVFVTEQDGYQLFDDDGTQLVSAPLAAQSPGIPCVADFDGDGAPEIAVSTYYSFALYELDGTVDWTAATNDAPPSGCAGFDFDRDGAAEIVYGDFFSLMILDGRTGTTLFGGARTSDGQGSDAPLVVDVDNDGAAEIVVGSSGGFYAGILVYGQVGDLWPGAGLAWGVQDFADANQLDDGSIPTPAVATWQTSNLFRARTGLPLAHADLVVTITDVCIADLTYGPVKLGIQVANQGYVDAPAGLTAQVFAEESTGPRSVATVTLPAIAAGTSIDGIEVPLTAADLGTEGFSVTVDADGGIDECDEANNTAIWVE